MKIKILYEDKNILVIDKPSGIVVHADGRSKEPTVTDWVIKNYPKMKNVGEPMTFLGKEIKRPGVVHRLDKETSGVLVLAKNQKAHEFLKSQFMDREIKKKYIAIVSGWVKNDHGIINKPIGRSPSDFRRRLAGRGARGELREAITEYKVLKRFTAPCVQNFSSCALPRVRGGTLGDKNFKHTAPFSYLEVKPKTGRTHQIRVHMKYLNHPVVCDSLYNPKGPLPSLPLTKGEEKGGGHCRLMLHAKSIEFKDLRGKIIKVESPVPKEFKKFVS